MKDALQNDEISLFDIIKVLYKWKYFIISFIIIITCAGAIYYKVFLQDDKYMNYSIIRIGKIGTTQIQTSEELNFYLKSDLLRQEIENMIGQKNILKYLNISDENEKENNLLIKRKWQDSIEFSKNKLITKSHDINLVTKVNTMVVKKVIDEYEKKLKKELQIYYNNYSTITKNLAKIINKENVGKLLIPLNIPNYYMTKVNQLSENNIPIRIKKSFKKFIIIIFFIASFFSVFLAFLIDFLKKINWKELKNSMARVS